MPNPTSPERPTSPAALWLAGCIVLGGLFFLAVELWYSYHQALQRAETDSANLSELLSQRINGTLIETDMLLQELSGHITAVPEQIHPNDPLLFLLDELLRNRQGRLGQIETLELVNRQGLVVSSTAERGRRVEHTDYFRRLKRGETRWLSTPNIESGQNRLLLARRLAPAPIPFQGLVSATIRPDSLHSLFGRLDIGGHSAIALTDPDARLVLRLPPAQRIEQGVVIPNATVLRQGSFPRMARLESPIDGVDRVFYFRKLDNYDLVVVVGLASTDYLASWRIKAGVYGLGALGLLALATVLLLVSLRDRQRAAALSQSEARLREREAQLRVALTAAPLPIALIRLDDNRISFANPAWEHQFGLSPGSAEGSPIGQCFVQPQDYHEAQRQDSPHDGVELTMRRRNGEEFIALASFARVKLNDGDRLLIGLNDISALKTLQQELRRQANTDPLTGLASRRYLLEMGEQAIKRQRRHGGALAVLMIDLDRFKTVNDRYGHGGGDEVLRRFARICHEQLRESDLIGRLGGEEFLALLPQTGLEGALSMAERLRLAVELQPVKLGPDTEIAVTISLGVALLQHGESLEKLLARADQALYAAKEEGRNRVVVWSSRLEKNAEPPAQDGGDLY
ncbi:diguanylate cyclase [Chitinimonas lacunae]|uniref:diguanylate cyclase n=1 Tax=Chitinimonas lacunae TaxID=1963018 RepID=A0ABV8MP03_9NEIS